MRKIFSAIPNLLSFSRIVISPLIFIAIKNNDLSLIIALAVWAVLSDYLDGMLARRWNAISETGKILDPVGDKLCIAIAAISLTLYSNFPLWLFLIIVGRDFFIVLFGVTIIGKAKQVPSSNIIGKITVTVLAIVLLVYIFKLEFLYNFASGAALFFVILSSVGYLFIVYKLISRRS